MKHYMHYRPLHGTMDGPAVSHRASSPNDKDQPHGPNTIKT